MIGYLKFVQQMKFFVLNLLFMGIGFHVANAQDTTIQVVRAPVLLKEVVVSNKNKKVVTLGTKGFTPFFWVSVSAKNDALYEHGKLIQIKQPAKLLTANVRVEGNKRSKDSVTYQLNLYKFRNGLPAERIINKNIIKTFPGTSGLLTFDLISENIHLDQDCIVAFEYLPRHHKPGKLISLRASMLGGDAFVRATNSETWIAFKNGSAAIFVEVEQ
jgi:hypothetical protein